MIDRILERIEIAGDGCWRWTGATFSNGYGQFRGRRTHRLIYEALVGPIPIGSVLDHTCHNNDDTCPGGNCRHRLCCNPDHLLATSQRSNVLASRHTYASQAKARTACINGHALEGRNLYVDKRGCRSCMACRAVGKRAYRAEGRIA